MFIFIHVPAARHAISLSLPGSLSLSLISRARAPSLVRAFALALAHSLLASRSLALSLALANFLARSRKLLQCPAFARGPLCAVCEPRFVPDSSASDGSCKECNTNAMGRWRYKIITVILAGVVFFLVSLVVVTMPAPSLKIDSFLRTVNVRRIIRRVRKKYLLISIEKEVKKRRESAGHLAPLTAKKVRRFSTMVEQGRFDEAVQFRRAGFVASSAGVAAASLSSPAVAGAVRGARALLRSGIAEEVGDQIGHTADETIGDAFRGDAADVGAQGLGETMDESGAQVCFYLPLHFKRILLTILTCPPHILTF